MQPHQVTDTSLWGLSKNSGNPRPRFMDSCFSFKGHFVLYFGGYHYFGSIPYTCLHTCNTIIVIYIHVYIYISSRFAVRYHPPPPPPMVWSQNLRFAAFCMKALYLQCFLHGGWLARSANLQIRRISCNQPSENVFFAMFRLRRPGVVPLHPRLCQIII